MKSNEQPVMCLTEVAWREVGEEDTIEHHWAPSAACPLEGEVRWARIAPDDALKIGQKCWLFYMPPNALANGFTQEYNPFDLDLCAIVEVELTQVLLPRSLTHTDPVFQWIECRCFQVVPLARIPDVFPAIPIIDKRDSNLSSTVGRTVTYFIERAQEVRNWYVITNPKESRHALPRMVLSGLSLDSYGFISNCAVECDKTSWRVS